jgi:protein-tyrosine-phosphatase
MGSEGLLGKKVLFVCTGNTCRSPMAAGLLKDAALKSGLDLQVDSAGIAAFPGVPYTPEAVEALKEKGVDLSGGSSQPLSKPLVMESDLILTMTVQHKDVILRKLPALSGKVHLFSEFAGEVPTDVDDPAGHDLDTYRKVRDQMARYVGKTVDRLKG